MRINWGDVFGLVCFCTAGLLGLPEYLNHMTVVSIVGMGGLIFIVLCQIRNKL